jgi:hypothetical protein
MVQSGSHRKEFDIWSFFKQLSREFEFHSNLTRIAETLHEDVHTFMVIVLLNSA